MVLLVRPLTHIIPRGGVVAHPDLAAIGAHGMTAAEGRGCLPHHLGVVAADLPSGTSVIPIGVMRLLTAPSVGHLGLGNGLLFAAAVGVDQGAGPEDVFA